MSFLEGDPAEMRFDRPFDAVIGRLLPMYYPDSVGTVRRLAEHVREGGLIVFQEFDIANCRSLPLASTYETHISWIKQAPSATGARTQLGLIGGGPDCPAYELAAEVSRSLCQ